MVVGADNSAGCRIDVPLNSRHPIATNDYVSCLRVKREDGQVHPTERFISASCFTQ